MYSVSDERGSMAFIFMTGMQCIDDGWQIPAVLTDST